MTVHDRSNGIFTERSESAEKNEFHFRNVETITKLSQNMHSNISELDYYEPWENESDELGNQINDAQSRGMRQEALQKIFTF